MQKGDGFLSKVRESMSWWRHWYISDWAIILFSTIVVGVMFESVPGIVPPFARFRPSDKDPSIMYPLRSSIIPTWLAGVTAIVLPLVCLTLAQIFVKSFHDFHHSLLALLQTLSMTFNITAVLKVTCGRYRPNFIAITEQVTSTTGIRDGKMSFPSGHSSISFCSMFFLSLYLSGKLGIFKKNGHSPILISLLCFSPMIIAFATTVSRVMDYHHNFSDILAGAVLGTVIAFICYSLHFFPLNSSRCDKPKSMNELTDEHGNYVKEDEHSV